MANTVEITKLLDGPRYGVYHIFLKSDGSGDLENTVLINPTEDFTPPYESLPSMAIETIQYDLSGFSARLEFEYLINNTPIWSMSEGPGSEVDFTNYGGVRDRSGILDGTGNLLLTTSGFSIGDFGTIVIKVKKD